TVLELARDRRAQHQPPRPYEDTFWPPKVSLAHTKYDLPNRPKQPQRTAPSDSAAVGFAQRPVGITPVLHQDDFAFPGCVPFSSAAPLLILLNKAVFGSASGQGCYR